MSDDIAIRVNGLGKKYRISHETASYKTLGETITRAARAPFRRLTGEAPSRSTEEFWALKDVSFEVKRGEVVGIIGRNGAGKSTLLKILSRITTPTEGTIEVHGRIGSLLEVGTGFHPELSGRENIYLSGSILGMKRSEIDAKFDEIVKFAEMEKFLDTPVKRYSSGMYVRLAFAVAAHLEPEILIVDEVLAVGDAAFQKKCLGKMGDVAKEGRTVLFVSHNMGAIGKLCNSAIFVHEGKIKAIGPTEKIVNGYLNDQRNFKPTWTLKQGSNDKEIGFSQVFLIDQTLHQLEVVTTASDMAVVMDFYLRREISDLQISIAITDQNGDILFASAPQDVGLLPPSDKGFYRATCRLPPGIFLAKNYSIIPSLWSPKDGGLDQISNFWVSVQEENSWSNQIVGGRTGYLAIRCNWEISTDISSEINSIG